MITETIKIFRRPEIVTVARESADVIIYGFAYRIWIENTELLLEKIEEKVGEIYLNEQRILMERGSVTLKLQMAHPNGQFCGAKRSRCVAERSDVVRF